MRLSLLSLLLAAAPAAAQDPLLVVPVENVPGTVSVVGKGSVSVAPDYALVRLGVTTRAETAPEALREHEADVARVLARVRQAGVPDRDIRISELRLGEDYGPDGPQGYVAQRVVGVTTDSLRGVPALVAAVVSEGANRLDGLQYLVRDTGPAEGEALEAALADARAKAERVARAAGVSLGRVVAVHEHSERGVVFNESAAYVSVSDAGAPPQPGAYSTGATTVEARVTVLFEIAEE